MRFRTVGLILSCLFFIPSGPLSAQETPPAEPPANYLFRNQFYLSPAQKLQQNTFQLDNFLVVENLLPEWNSKMALVTSFASQVVRTRVLKDIQSVDQAREWIQAHKEVLDFEGVPVVALPFASPDGQAQKAYWVGQKSFDSFDRAAAEITMTKTLTEVQGGDFHRAVKLAEEFEEPEPVPSVEEVKARAQFKKEEEIAFKWMDQLDIGEELYGPFHGVPAGEPILWQSFGEGSYRTTNLAVRKFNSVVSYWTQRLVFKGVRFPLNTLDPFIELTTALETTGNDGGSQLDTSAGFEWRPLARNAWLENFRPGGIPLLKFAKNYRFYLQYFNRRNLKDEIANIRDEDFRVGWDIYYEWGIDLTPPGEKPETGWIGLLKEYSWGEYFGNYGWRHTNFTTEENYDAWILDSSLIFGFKTPALRVPHNPINDELVLMPYVKFALTSNTEFSNPFDNRVYVSVGVRWMPFRSYEFQNNEWLFKTKFFAEYLALGKVQYLKQENDNRPLPDEDWRIGINFSFRRF